MQVNVFGRFWCRYPFWSNMSTFREIATSKCIRAIFGNVCEEVSKLVKVLNDMYFNESISNWKAVLVYNLQEYEIPSLSIRYAFRSPYLRYYLLSGSDIHQTSLCDLTTHSHRCFHKLMQLRKSDFGNCFTRIDEFGGELSWWRSQC